MEGCQTSRKDYESGSLLGINYKDVSSDFVFPEGNKISIIEVKSGKDYKLHTSLNMAQSLFADKINRRIVMSSNNLETADGVIYLPFYMSMFI